MTHHADGPSGRRDDPPAWLGWASLAAFAVLWWARWPSLPLGLDPAYHLFVAREMLAAGGPFLSETWQYAPVGRAHLYPPGLHVLLAGLMGLGLDPLLVIRLVCAGLPVALLGALYAAARRMADEQVAVSCLWAALVPTAFWVHSATALAATMALGLWLWWMVAVQERRWRAAGALFVLLGYTHLALPWIALLAALLAGCWDPGARAWWRKGIWAMTALLPWYLHVLRHRAVIHVVPRLENAFVDVMPALWALAAVGAVAVCRRAARARRGWWLAAWLAAGFCAWRWPYRWLNGEGMLPVLLMAGAGLAECARRLSPVLARFRGGGRPGLGPWTMAAGLLFGLLIMSPTLSHGPSGWRWVWPDSTPAHLLRLAARSNSLEPLLPDGYRAELVRRVKGASLPGEPLWANAPYAAGQVAALAGRPLSMAMLTEVGPWRMFDPIAQAPLVLWFKLAPDPQFADIRQLNGYALQLVAEDEISVLWRQTGAAVQVPPPRAVMPLAAALALAGALAVTAGWQGEWRGARQPCAARL